MAALENIVVVGASLAGLRAIEALRRFGYDGRLTLVGAEQHLPYDRPPLSKELLRGDWEPDRIALRNTDNYGPLNLDLRLGRAAAALDTTDRCITLSDGATVRYDGLLIATGATPRTLPGTADVEGVYILRTLDDSLAIRAELERNPRVVVVGAGFIGAEVAAVCRQRGLDVTMLEALPAPMSRGMGERMGRILEGIHRDRGVDVRCGVGVRGIEGSPRVRRVVLDDGESVDADVVIVGIGVRPETGWLESSGLKLDNGVVCDQTCTASAPGVAAAGDLANWFNPRYGRTMRLEHWTNASDQGMAAAQTLLDGSDNAKPYSPLPFVWSDQYDANIQVLGLPEAAADFTVAEGSVENEKFIALYSQGEKLTAAVGVNAGRDLVAYRRLLMRDAPLADALAHAREHAEAG